MGLIERLLFYEATRMTSNPKTTGIFGESYLALHYFVNNDKFHHNYNKNLSYKKTIKKLIKLQRYSEFQK